jgi:hypothetical protein
MSDVLRAAVEAVCVELMTATARKDLEVVLHDRFGIEHTTLQVGDEGGDRPRDRDPRRWLVLPSFQQ